MSPDARSSDAICIDSVNKTFVSADGRRVTALHDVSLTVKTGEFVSVVGPSGCGKSTLLSLVAGLEPASRGRISISGTPVERPRRDLSIVFQNAVLLPWRRILANVLLPLDLGRRLTKKDRDRAMELLDLVGLTGFEHAYPKELSGGMQQRCAIARALMLDAPVMLLDEPFGALDALTREELNLEIQKIWMATGKTIVLITHDINEAVLLSDRVVVMSGRPGTILDTVDVTTSRPRSLADVDPGLGEQIRERLGVAHQPGRAETKLAAAAAQSPGAVGSSENSEASHV